MTWAQLDEDQCPCKGSGWAEVDNGVWKECRIHFEGQVHPETRTLLLDEPERLAEEDRRSRIRFQIKQLRDTNYELHEQIKRNKVREAELELELINRTPTVRAMPAVQLPKPTAPDELDWGNIFQEQ